MGRQAGEEAGKGGREPQKGGRVAPGFDFRFGGIEATGLDDGVRV